MDDAQRQLLDAMLAESDPNGRAFGELLRRHGPIGADEVPYLAEKAGERGTALAAVRLLAVGRSPEARAALASVAASTHDARVFALAVNGFLDEAGAAELAAARPKLIAQALRDDDPTVAAAALRVSWRAGSADVTGDLEKRLDDPSDRVRDAVVSILAESGPGPLQQKLVTILLDPGLRARYPMTALFRALCASDDPSTADAIRRALDGASPPVIAAFSNAVFLTPGHAPWLRDLLLDYARTDGPMRSSAFRRLADWGDDRPTRALVEIAAADLEKGGALDPTVVAGFLGGLAGRQLAPSQKDEMLAFAKSNLAGSSQ